MWISTFWLNPWALYRMSHWPLSSPLLSSSLLFTPSPPPPSPFLSLLHTMVSENRKSKFSSWLSPNCHVTCWKSPSLRPSVYPKERIGLKGHRNSDNFMCSLNPTHFPLRHMGRLHFPAYALLFWTRWLNLGQQEGWKQYSSLQGLVWNHLPHSFTPSEVTLEATNGSW